MSQVQAKITWLRAGPLGKVHASLIPGIHLKKQLLNTVTEVHMLAGCLSSHPAVCVQGF